MTTSTDRIERKIDIKAPRSRVWRALTNATELGQWFGMVLDGPLTPGAHVRGRITSPGYEHLAIDLVIERMDAEQTFSWRWHPHAIDKDHDYSVEKTTLVVFELEEIQEGTRLTLVESGFDNLPPERRATALRGNGDGWTIQMKAIERYVVA